MFRRDKSPFRPILNTDLDRIEIYIKLSFCLQEIILGMVEIAVPIKMYLTLLLFSAYIRNCLLVYIIKIDKERKMYINQERT
jgi:hypothetical protein